MKIKLHLGAHKTATTHIQLILENNRDILLDNKIRLLTPKDLRPNFITILKNISNSNLLKDVDILIISEENIAGVPYDLKISSGIYSNVKEKLNIIKYIFPNDDIEIFFSIRSYDEFYRSSYLEVVRNRGYIPFKDFYNQDRFINNSWLSVIKSFIEVVSEENITIWCYEDFKELTPLIISQLTDNISQVDKILLSYKDIRTRPSLSSRTINILNSFYSSNNKEEGNKIIEYLNNKYPISSNNPPYIPFNNKNRIRLQERYIGDINFIDKKYYNVNFLKVGNGR